MLRKGEEPYLHDARRYPGGQTGEIMTCLVYGDQREHEGENREKDQEELHESPSQIEV
jgi:hypothetical protein